MNDEDDEDEAEEQLELLHDVSVVIGTCEGIIPVYCVAPVTKEAEAIKSCIEALSPMREELKRIYSETHNKVFKRDSDILVTLGNLEYLPTEKHVGNPTPTPIPNHDVVPKTAMNAGRGATMHWDDLITRYHQEASNG